MKSSKVPSQNSFLRAAERRLLAARWLLRDDAQGQFGAEAVYLAGYAVECSLKALLLARTPASKRTAITSEITRGARWHNYERLKEKLKEAGWSPPPTLAWDFRHIVSWSTDLRYSSNRIPQSDALKFVESAHRIFKVVASTIK